MKTKLSRKKLRKTMRRAAPLAIPAALGIGAALGALAATYARAPLSALGAKARGWLEDRARPVRERANGAGRPIANPIASGL